MENVSKVAHGKSFVVGIERLATFFTVAGRIGQTPTRQRCFSRLDIQIFGSSISGVFQAPSLEIDQL